MKKVYCVICGMYRKLKKKKIIKKTLVFSLICSKCKNEHEKLFKEEQSIEILKIIGLIEIYNYFKNMEEENISQEFRWKNIDHTSN